MLTKIQFASRNPGCLICLSVAVLKMLMVTFSPHLTKIIWYNDVDDDVLMPVSSGPSGSSSSSKPMMLDWFFIAPAKTGGTRQSGRTTCPSTKILDPDNAESQGFFLSTGMKHKANPTGHAQVAQLSPCLQSRSMARSIQGTDADSQDEAKTNIDTVNLIEKTSSDVKGASSDDDAIEVSYQCTKALGDASLVYVSLKNGENC